MNEDMNFEGVNLFAIEGFLRTRCSHKQVLALDDLILRTEMEKKDHSTVVQEFIELQIKGVLADEQ